MMLIMYLFKGLYEQFPLREDGIFHLGMRGVKLRFFFAQCELTLRNILSFLAY